MNIITACAKIAEKGLVAGASGNVSERAGSSFRITASSTRLDSVKSGKDFFTIDTFSDDIPSGTSMETRMHREIYRQRPDAGAIIHANPPYSTLVSCAIGFTIDSSLIPEGALLNPVCFVGAYPAGSVELAQAAGSAAVHSNVLVLKKHGVVTVGKSMEEALNRMEYLELICRIIIISKSAGIGLDWQEVSGYE